MSRQLKTVRLRELCNLITKGTTPTTVGHRFTESGINFIKAEAVTLSGQIKESTFVHISEDTNKKLKRSQLCEHDILFSIAGMKLGKSGLVKKSHLPANTNQALAIIRPNTEKVIPAYLHYYFQNPIHYKYVNSLTGQAAQPNINLTDVGNLPIQTPDLQTQKKIAGILSAYDDLIENNLRRIQILEEMAQSLYREWFVHFRIPSEVLTKAGLPSVLKFKDSPLGPIPQDWEAKKLGELYKTSSGGTPSRKKPEYYEGGAIDWIKTRELKDGFILESEEKINAKGLAGSSAKMFPAGTVLIALYGATIGKLGILTNEAATNQACCAFLNTNLPYGRSFAFLTLHNRREDIIGLRLGAAQQNISQAILRDFEIICPNQSLIEQFNATIEPQFDLLLNLQKRNNSLRKTRDLLLPKLLNG